MIDYSHLPERPSRRRSVASTSGFRIPLLRQWWVRGRKVRGGPALLLVPVAIGLAVAFATTSRYPDAPISPDSALTPVPPPLTVEHTDIFGTVRNVQLESPGTSDSYASIRENLDSQADWNEIRIKKGDALLAVLTDAGVATEDIRALLQADAAERRLGQIMPGRVLRLRRSPTGLLLELRYPMSETETLRVWREPDHAAGKFQLEPVRNEAEIRTAYGSGIIHSALFIDGQNAGLSDAIIIQLSEIFGWDIDFSLDLRKGDRFSVIFEERFLDGRKLADGRVLAAEFINQGRVYRAIGFPSDGETLAYYTPDGFSLRRAFLRSPLKFSRITSGFSLKRFHPILKNWGAHTGIDYGAPTGTPVHATAEGRVQSAGANGGYGNVVVLRHGGSYSTVYAHLSGFAKGIRGGSPVTQGQVIGYVGATGLATGPHLHYEFRVDGTHKNPLTYSFPLTVPVVADQRESFHAVAGEWVSKLDVLGGQIIAELADAPGSGS